MSHDTTAKPTDITIPSTSLWAKVPTIGGVVAGVVAFLSVWALMIWFKKREIDAMLLEALDGASRIETLVRDMRMVATVDDGPAAPLCVNVVLEATVNVVLLPVPAVRVGLAADAKVADANISGARKFANSAWRKLTPSTTKTFVCLQASLPRVARLRRDA